MRAEQAVRDSGADLTVLHSTWFAQNFSEDYRLDYVLSGEVALPAGDTPEPFVDAADIADVAVAALTDDRHIGEVYELTGPRLLTFAEAVEEIARAAGLEIRYVPVSIEDFAAATAEQGMPGETIDLLTYLFSEVMDGRNAHLADGVQRALGRDRGTSATTRATRPPPASGTRRPSAPPDVIRSDAPGKEANMADTPQTIPKPAEGADRNADVVLGAAVIAMGLLAGLYFFSAIAVMPALTAAGDRTLVDAMQQMIDKIENPAFFLVLLGAPALAAVALVQARRSGSVRTADWIVAALVLYTVMAVITFAVNIPLNED